MKKVNVSGFEVHLREEFGVFTVVVPALPGCVTEADTEKEALESIQRAIHLYLRALAKDKGKGKAKVIPIESAGKKRRKLNSR